MVRSRPRRPRLRLGRPADNVINHHLHPVSGIGGLDEPPNPFTSSREGTRSEH
jgi:hypothetical protein